MGKREKYRVIMRQDVDECEGERRKEWRATAEAKCGVVLMDVWSRRVEVPLVPCQAARGSGETIPARLRPVFYKVPSTTITTGPYESTKNVFHSVG